MTYTIIEPRDTLVLGDGRSIGESVANRSIDVPWPSTLAGTLRTEAGRDPQSWLFHANPNEARGWAVRGPLLVELDQSGTLAHFLFTVPKDGVFFEREGGGVDLRSLTPVPDRGLTDLPDDLQRVSFRGEGSPAKPAKGTTRYWSWEMMRHWLQSPTDVPNWKDPRGLTTPLRDKRISVAIDSTRRTTIEGNLFEVEHVLYATQDRRFALWGEVDRSLSDRAVSLGGERRLSFLRTSADYAPPAPPEEVLQKIEETGKARLILATPAVFDQGYRPSAIPGATLIAAAVDRPQVISGWDWASRRPKPARRTAPAGSVYWVEITQSDRRAWVHDRWLRSLSSDEQDQKDGFGLTLVGAYQ